MKKNQKNLFPSERVAAHANMGLMATRTIVSGRRRGLRIAVVIVPSIAFVALLVAGVMQGPAGNAGDAGVQAPAFTAPRLDGTGTVSLEDLRGKPVVLNFWASWCEPCKEEAPLLAAAARTYGDKVRFVGMDIHDARSDARKFVLEHGLRYLQLRDETGEVARAYGLTGQPETFFIDPAGSIVRHVPGLLDQATLNDVLQPLTSSGR